MTVLFFGDVVGKIGRKAVKKILPSWKRKYKPDFIIANGENLAHGIGVTEKTVREIFEAGVDFLTGGNHSLKREAEWGVWDESVFGAKMIRPANINCLTSNVYRLSQPVSSNVHRHSSDIYDKRQTTNDTSGDTDKRETTTELIPGEGAKIVNLKGKKLMIINLIGRVFFKEEYEDPFKMIDDIISDSIDVFHSADNADKPSAKSAGRSPSAKSLPIILDFHAEATSEKNAMAWYLDGKVSAIIGTHTHIPTCDAKILPKGAAYITDVGMVGAKNSILGIDKDVIIESFLQETGFKHIIEEEGEAIVSAVLIKIDEKTGRAKNIKRLEEMVNI